MSWGDMNSTSIAVASEKKDSGPSLRISRRRGLQVYRECTASVRNGLGRQYFDQPQPAVKTVRNFARSSADQMRIAAAIELVAEAYKVDGKT